MTNLIRKTVSYNWTCVIFTVLGLNQKTVTTPLTHLESLLKTGESIMGRIWRLKASALQKRQDLPGERLVVRSGLTLQSLKMWAVARQRRWRSSHRTQLVKWTVSEELCSTRCSCEDSIWRRLCVCVCARWFESVRTLAGDVYISIHPLPSLSFVLWLRHPHALPRAGGGGGAGGSSGILNAKI